jgi:hypothetical protein
MLMFGLLPVVDFGLHSVQLATYFWLGTFSNNFEENNWKMMKSLRYGLFSRYLSLPMSSTEGPDSGTLRSRNDSG